MIATSGALIGESHDAELLSVPEPPSMLSVVMLTELVAVPLVAEVAERLGGVVLDAAGARVLGLHLRVTAQAVEREVGRRVQDRLGQHCGGAAGPGHREEHDKSPHVRSVDARTSGRQGAGFGRALS